MSKVKTSFNPPQVLNAADMDDMSVRYKVDRHSAQEVFQLYQVIKILESHLKAENLLEIKVQIIQVNQESGPTGHDQS